jgi:anaerobic magnesium-protoporphyrin IX monomethyl ester cyclase
MENKVLLIMPMLDPGKDYHHFPFGCLALAASLETLGIGCDIFDERVTSEESILDRLSDYAIIGVSMFTGYQTHRGHYWLSIVRQRNPQAITIAGGPHVTALPEETVASPLVDYAVAGYAESSFGHLVSHILATGAKHGASSLALPGVYSKGGSSKNIIFGTKTPKKYADIPWAALPYHKLDMARYINPKTRLVMYISQYGCPALCTFCATPETRKWTSKPLSIVYKDLDNLDRLTSFRRLCFFDATLFTTRTRTMELVAHLDQRFAGREWLADARAAELIRYTEDDLYQFRNCRMNLLTLVVGLESGSVRLAEGLIKKGRGHLRNFYEVAKRTHAAGIDLLSGVIFGFPGETIDDLEETIKYVREIRKVHPKFKISTTFFGPLPGTDLYDLVREKGYLTINSFEHWAEYGEKNHFKYNEWSNPPWFSESETRIYLEGYQRFMDEHGDICV